MLFLTQVLPYPLDAGPKVRAYHMLRRLAAQHDVTLVSFLRSDDSPEAVSHLRTICAQVHTVPMRRSSLKDLRAGFKGLVAGLPVVIARDEIGPMFTILRALAQQAVDVIHADQLSMAGYAQFGSRIAGQARGSRPATVLDEHNALYCLAERMAAAAGNPIERAILRREATAFAKYERAMCRWFDALFTVTQEDRRHLLDLFSPAERALVSRRISVVPIGVDPSRLGPVQRSAEGPPTILHVGTMFWPPNAQGVLWFAREVLPRVRARVPGARFVVVGKKPPPEVLSLARDPSIQVTGYRPDPTPYVAAADVFVVPLAAGGGMRVKILDGWLWGLPVVSTALGAEGIETMPGEDILLSPDGDVEAFADAVVRVLTDPDLNAKLRVRGRAAVEARYSWQGMYNRVDAVYAKLLSDTSSRIVTGNQRHD